MSRSINVILNLKDQFTAPLKKATANAKTTERSFKMSMNKIKKFGSNMAKTAVKGIAVGIGAVTAATGLFLKQSVDAYNEATLQVTKMETVLKNNKGITAGQIDDLKQYTSTLQARGVVEDDILKAGITSVGVFGLQADSIKKLLPGIADLAVKEKGLNVTSEDMANYGKLIGKAMSGQAGALKKAGIVIDKHQEAILKTGSESQKAALIADLLKQKVGGVNEAMAQTDAGRIQQLKNDFGDFQEEIGAMVLPILGEFATWFKGEIPTLKEKVISLIETFKKFVSENEPQINQIKDTLSGLGTTIIEVGGYFVSNFDKFAPIIATVVAGFTAYKAIMLGTKIVTFALTTAELIKNGVLAGGATAVNAVTIAQWAWNAAMTANPIGVVIGVITVLIAVAILVWKNWDKIKAKTTELWNKFMNFLKPAIDTAKGAFDAIVNTVKNVIDGFNKVKDAIGGAIGKLLNWNNTKAEDKNLKVTETNQGGGSSPGRKALGTSYFKGGITQINENKRSETVILPNGSKVLSHEQSKRQGNVPNVSVSVTVQGNMVGNEEFVDYMGNKIVTKVMNAYRNM